MEFSFINLSNYLLNPFTIPYPQHPVEGHSTASQLCAFFFELPGSCQKKKKTDKKLGSFITSIYFFLYHNDLWFLSQAPPQSVLQWEVSCCLYSCRVDAAPYLQLPALHSSSAFFSSETVCHIQKLLRRGWKNSRAVRTKRHVWR